MEYKVKIEFPNTIYTYTLYETNTLYIESVSDIGMYTIYSCDDPFRFRIAYYSHIVEHISEEDQLYIRLKYGI